MKKSKILAIFGVTTLASAAVVVSTNDGFKSLFAENDPGAWGHYSATEAIDDCPGCVEYWVQCDTGVISFVEPDGVIYERGLANATQLIDIAENYSNDGRTVNRLSTAISLGRYPSTKVVDSDVTAALDAIEDLDDDGYKNYENNSYLPYENGSGYDYYLVEDINWKLIGSDVNGVSFISEKSLDYCCFDDVSADYDQSMIYNFLNDDLFEKAFTSDEKNLFAETNKIVIPTVNMLCVGGEYKDDFVVDFENTDYSKRSVTFNDAYWTRTVNTSNGELYVVDNGDVGSPTSTAENSSSNLVRPVIRLKNRDIYNGLLNTDPVIDEENGMIEYGYYPQTVVSDATLSAQLDAVRESFAPNSKGWYYYGGEFYGYIENPTANKTTGHSAIAGPNTTYKNGELVNSAGYHWFKIEPLKWRILENEMDEYLVMADELYFTGYNRGTNTYNNSHIRNTLNETLVNDCFIDSSRIIEREIDNSEAVTLNETSVPNTVDKLFLPSYADMVNTDYFPDQDSRMAFATDYARAKEASVTEYGSGIYELRARINGGRPGWYSKIYWGGTFGYNSDDRSTCLRPCMRIAKGEMEPIYNAAKNTITYGYYPQTLVTDSTAVTALKAMDSSMADEKGYYPYQGNLYAPVIAASGTYNFSLDELYTVGSEGTDNVLWFKVEPIVWNVLSADTESNDYFVIANKILDNRDLFGTDVAYEDSDIRNFLSGDFMDIAFDGDTTYVKLTTIGKDDENNDVNDYVYLPSVDELTNSDYGFNAEDAFDANRLKKYGDYAVAKGAIGYTIESDDETIDGVYFGQYMTRTVTEDAGTNYFNYFMPDVDGDTIFASDSSDSVKSFLPAMHISLK